MLVKVQEEADIRPAPGVNRLIRITHDEKILMIASQHTHQLVLERVDILKLVHHDVLETRLPLPADVFVLFKNIERELDEVIVVEGEAFFLLIKVSVKNDVFHIGRLVVFFVECGNRHRDHIPIVLRLKDALFHLDHIARFGEWHIPQCQLHFLIHHREHIIDVRIVDHHEAFRVRDSITVFLQD